MSTNIQLLERQLGAEVTEDKEILIAYAYDIDEFTITGTTPTYVETQSTSFFVDCPTQANGDPLFVKFRNTKTSLIELKATFRLSINQDADFGNASAFFDDELVSGTQCSTIGVLETRTFTIYDLRQVEPGEHTFGIKINSSNNEFADVTIFDPWMTVINQHLSSL